MEPSVGHSADSALDTKGLKPWAGTLVGAILGFVAGLVGLTIEVFDLNFGPPLDPLGAFRSWPPEWGPLGALSAVVGGAIAGTIGLRISEKVGSKGGAAVGGLVGGAIGAAIGAIAFYSGVLALLALAGGISGGIGGIIGGIILTTFVSAIVGAIVGSLAGLMVAIFGMSIGSATPLVALVGCCAGAGLGAVSSLPAKTGLLGLVISVVIWSGVAMITARRDHAFTAEINRAASHGAFGAAIGGVAGAISVVLLAYGAFIY